MHHFSLARANGKRQPADPPRALGAPQSSSEASGLNRRARAGRFQKFIHNPTARADLFAEKVFIGGGFDGIWRHS